MISGDSNAGNWGQRENGELVLFDWERFSTGHVAIDLAPLIEGMGTFDDYLKVAGRYIKCAEKGETTELALDIGLAKAWIVVEVVNILVSRKIRRPANIWTGFDKPCRNGPKALALR